MNARRQEPLWAILEAFYHITLFKTFVMVVLAANSLEGRSNISLWDRAGLASHLLEKQWVPPNSLFSHCTPGIYSALFRHPRGPWGQEGLMQAFLCACFLCCAVSKTNIFLWLTLSLVFFQHLWKSNRLTCWLVSREKNQLVDLNVWPNRET